MDPKSTLFAFRTYFSFLLILLSGQAVWAQNTLVNLSHERGFYQNPFSLSITANQAQTSIRYTTDGSKPSFFSGTLYTGPISIQTTTTLRYLAWSPLDTTEVVTHTYLFLADVITQSSSQSGYPSGMDLDASIVNDPVYGPQLIAALEQIPSVSVVLDVQDFNTIYYTKGTTRDVSIELIYPDGRPAYWQNGGVESYGNSTFNQAKKNFRFVFKEQYEATKYEYPLFGPGGADDFDYWVLRAGGQETFLKGGTQNLNDQFVRELQLKISGSGVRGDFYHVYVNGLYWGVYNAAERPQKSFAQSYFGGEKDDWNTLKATCCNTTLFAIDGNRNTWDSLLLHINDYNKAEQFIDIDHFIDYVMICNYGPHGDWRTWNTYIVDNPTIGEKLRLFVWDVEPSLKSDWYYTNITVNTRDYNNVWNPLKANADFRMRVADHMACNCLEGGALHPDSTAQGYQAIFDETSQAYLLEAARWADKTIYDDFLTYRSDLMSSYFPNRTQTLINTYQSNNLYPNLDPVTYSLAAGQVSAGTTISLSNPNATGTIYYTLDGSDPRSAGGAISPTALQYTGPIALSGGVVTLKTRVYDTGVWSANCPKTYYLPQNYSQLEISELHYHPHDTLGGAAAEFLELYNPGPGLVEMSNAYFSSGITYTFPLGSLIGENQYWVIARDTSAFYQQYGIHADGQYQARLSNQGEFVELEDPFGGTIDSLHYQPSEAWDWPPNGQGPSLELKQSGLDNALASSWGSSWTLGGSPGSSNSLTCASLPLPLTINELNYHYQTDPPSLDAGDWIELFNPLGNSRDLSNWQLRVNDSVFVLPSGASIAPFGYYVLARDQVDFLRTHPGVGPLSPSFGFALPNDAARIAIVDDQACVQAYLQYEDNAPWPTTVDGDGPTLSLIDNPLNLTQPSSWFGSSNYSGSPGEANTFLPCSSPDIIINEIYYRGPNNPNPGDWIELYNPSANPQDLSEWEIHAGSNFFRFPAGTTIGAYGYLVIVEDHLSFAPLYPWISNALGNMGFGFDGDGEYVALFSGDRCMVDYVEYNDSPPWPQSPDGLGPSLSLVDPSFDNTLAGSWAGSNLGGAPFGTPGLVNNLPDPCQNISAEASQILINEIVYNSPPGFDGGNWLELYNPSGSVLDLSGWQLHVSDSAFVFPAGTSISAQSYLIIAEDPTALQSLIPSLSVPVEGPTGFGFSNNGERLLLYSESACLIDTVAYDDQLPWPPEADGHGPSLSLKDPILDNALGYNWERSPGAGTPGTANDQNPCAANLATIIINEINYYSSPLSDAGDWIELYNTGPSTIDISGWILQDQGNSYVIPPNSLVPSAGYFVMAADTLAFANQHPGIAKIGPIGFNFSNGGEYLALLKQDYCVVDSLTYDAQSPWPLAANGQGPSLMLIDPNLDNHLASNWIANTPQGTPGQANAFVCEPASSLAGPVMWLRAGDGFVLNSSTLSAWNDQSGNSNDALQSAIGQQPLVITTDTMRFNGHSFLTFDGSNDELDFDNTLLDNTQYTMYGVVERLNSSQNYFLGTQTNSQNKGLHLGLRSNTRATLAHYSNDIDVVVPAYNASGGSTPEIIRGRLDQVGKSISLIRNGQSYLGSHSSTSPMTDTGPGVIGNGFSSQNFDGHIAEILLYQRPLDELELRRVNNYFNLRYGVPISVEEHLFYAYGSYPAMIAGIGNAPAQCVEQLQARSTSRGSVLSLRNPSDLAPGEFMFWGHDNGLIQEVSYHESPAYTHRLERVWRVHKEGELGTVDLYFDLSGSGISLIDSSDFTLIIDHSGGDFIQLEKHTYGQQIIGDQVWFRDVAFVHGDAFTLATQSTACPVSQIETIVEQFTCNPALVGRDTTVFNTASNCDSLLILETFLRVADTTYLDVAVCDPSLQGTSSQIFNNQYACDSVVITQAFLAQDTLLILEPVCAIVDTGLVLENLFNRYGCDSVVYRIKFFAKDTVRFFSESCDPALVGEDTLRFLNRYGCDSVLIDIVTPAYDVQQPSPGLLGCNLDLWLRADLGLQTNGDTLLNWLDQSKNAILVSQNLAIKRPVRVDSQLNGHPMIAFDGVDDWLSLNDIATTLGNNSSYFMVLQNMPQASDGYYLSVQTGGNEGLGLGQNTNGNLIYKPTATLSNEDWRDRPLMLSGLLQTDQQLSSYLQGELASPAIGFSNSGANRISLGQTFTGTGNENETSAHWKGQIAELIVYDTLVWAGGRQRVESYLAIKYGLSIPVSSHLYYHHSSHANYQVGIGRDSMQALAQLRSRSALAGSIVEISAISELGEANYVVLGHDGSDATASQASTNVPQGVIERMTRVWRVSETGETDTVSLKFDLNGLGWANPDPRSWVLMIDDDGDFTNAGLSQGVYGDDLRFEVDLVDGQYVSLGRREYRSVNAKAILAGAYQAASGLMRDDLRQQALIPVLDPYIGERSIESEVLNISGADAIVDWIMLELRSPIDSQVISQKPALLQRDGDIVDVDGSASVLFFADQVDNYQNTDSFYLAVKHRNHLSVMTDSLRYFAEGESQIDFSSGQAILGDYSQKVIAGGVYGLWSGDVNGDGKLVFQGSSNDPTQVFIKILSATANAGFARNFVLTGYENQDTNLDGQVIFQGAGSDINPIFINILSYPENTSFSRNYVIFGELP
ncbi:MAG: lamin tail domain-containing protein [Bacteroidia bacterium]